MGDWFPLQTFRGCKVCISLDNRLDFSYLAASFSFGKAPLAKDTHRTFLLDLDLNVISLDVFDDLQPGWRRRVDVVHDNLQPPTFLVAFASYQDPKPLGKTTCIWTLDGYPVGTVFCILLSGTDLSADGSTTCSLTSTARPSNPERIICVQTRELSLILDTSARLVSGQRGGSVSLYCWSKRSQTGKPGRPTALLGNFASTPASHRHHLNQSGMPLSDD